jgi:hypothetical protein
MRRRWVVLAVPVAVWASACGGQSEEAQVKERVERFLESYADKAHLDGLRDAKVVSVTVSGDRAAARLEGLGSLELRRRDGEWRVAGHPEFTVIH